MLVTASMSVYVSIENDPPYTAAKLTKLSVLSTKQRPMRSYFYIKKGDNPWKK